MVLSAIYPYNKEAIYYFSSIIAFIGLCIMAYISTWPNASIIGKKSTYDIDSKSVELPELKVEKSIEEKGAVVPDATEELPKTNGSLEEQQTMADPVVTEKKSSENDQTPTKEGTTVLTP